MTEKEKIERLKRDYEVVLEAWKFLKTYFPKDAGTRHEETNMDIEWLRLYKKHDGAHDDFAHKILDAVLGEVEQQHGGET